MKFLLSNRYLPYSTAISGLLMALLTWYCFKSLALAPAGSIKIALYPAVFIIGIIIAVLAAMAVYLLQVIREYAAVRVALEQKVNNELARRVKAEENIKKLETALLHGQKLQTMGTLAGGIAHDFNNLIYVIKGYVELAREDVEKNTLAYHNLEKVLEAAQYAQGLVVRLLAFAKDQPVEFNKFSLSPCIESLLSLLKPTIPAGIIIKFTGLPDDCIIQADQTQLQQMMFNLIANAVDAMNEQGALTITLNKTLADDDYLSQFSALAAAHYYKIEINDTGCGMEQKTLERIFEPFYTTKEAGKGTGLGLSTVHSIIKQHNGEITATSQLGRGTSFTILLPAL